MVWGDISMNYWGLHHSIHETEINNFNEGKRREYKSIPADAEVNPNDVVFLFRGDEYLYGYGTVITVGESYAESSGQMVKDITVNPQLLIQQIASVDDIKQTPAFQDFVWTKRNGVLSFLNPEQFGTLAGLLPNDRAKPAIPPSEVPEGWERIAQTRDLRGGQGSIIKVRNKGDGRLGALKRLHPKDQKITERRGRAQREVTALEMLNGEGTPAVLESNVDRWKEKGVDLYAIFEWVDGCTLWEYLNRRKLTIDEALNVTLALLDILERCHDLQILHRDIKPDNIILKNGELATPVIIDFGMAFAPSPEEETSDIKTGEGQELGNRYFRLPEYAPGQHAFSLVADLTHLLGLMFSMITGRKPVQLQDARGRMPHESFADSIPETVRNDPRWKTLEAIFNVGFQHNVNDRFQSAPELRRYLNMLKSSAHNPGKERLELALRQLNQVTNSDEVRLPHIVKKLIGNVTSNLFESLSSAAREAGFVFDNNRPGVYDENGKIGSNMLLGIYKPGQEGVGAPGHHAVEFKDGQLIARYQVEGGEHREYFRGSVYAPALFEMAVANIVPDILSALVEQYIVRMNQKYKR